MYIQTRIYPGKWDAQNSQGFWDANRSPNLGQMFRISDSVQKKTLLNNGLYDTDGHRVKIKENEKSDKYQDIARELKIMELECDSDTNCNWCTWNNSQRLGKRLRNQKISGDHLDYSIIKIAQNTGKSPGDLRRLPVTQSPVEDHQLTLVWKTHGE